MKTLDELNANAAVRGESMPNIEGYHTSNCKKYVVGVYNSDDCLLLNFPVKFDANNIS